MPSTETISFSSTNREAPCAGLSVVMVDPSCFSIHYDYSLCNALVEQGCRVKLAHSEFRHHTWQRSAAFEVWKHFYSRTSSLARQSSGRWLKITKAAEHAVDIQRLASILARQRPDVIHFQWLPLPMLDRLSLARMHRIAPLVLTLHNTNLQHGSPDSVLQVLGFGSVFKYMSAVIVHTDFSRARVLSQGWTTSDKIHVVSHGVFDHYRQFVPEVKGPCNGRHRMLFLGSLESYKGVDLLLDAFARLPRTLAEATELVISGLPGKQADALRERSRTLGIDHRVQWNLRFISEQEVAALFASASAVVLPYREADQSAALLTAVALGTPVIATRVGGIPETIQDGVHGRIVEPGNVNALAAAMEDVLTHPDRRDSMQHALARLADGPLSWANVARQTVSVYRECLASRPIPTSAPKN